MFNISFSVNCISAAQYQKNKFEGNRTLPTVTVVHGCTFREGQIYFFDTMRSEIAINYYQLNSLKKDFLKSRKPLSRAGNLKKLKVCLYMGECDRYLKKSLGNSLSLRHTSVFFQISITFPTYAYIVQDRLWKLDTSCEVS